MKVFALLIALVMSISVFAEDKNQILDVQKELQSLRTQQPSEVSPGDYIYLEESIVINNSNSDLLSYATSTVLSKYETATSFQFLNRFEYFKKEYNGQYSHHIQNQNIELKKGQPSIYQQMPNGNYSDLKVEEIELEIPDRVKKSPNCGGLANCDVKLKGKKVSFTFVDQYGRKFFRTVVGSPEVPFMASPLSSCYTYVQQTEVVTQCLKIEDFYKK
jgi:hypothetical protein